MLSSGSIIVLANSQARCRERKLYDPDEDQPTQGPRETWKLYSLDVHNNGKIPRQSFI